MTELTAEEARLRLSYDPDTGLLTWLHDPTRSKTFNSKWAGKKAGYVNAAGYVFVGLRGYGSKWMFFGHRLAWLIHYGQWPVGEIDHLNGDRADNRLVNLRAVTHSENMANRQKKRAASGHVGVYWIDGRWVAQISRSRKVIVLGRFRCKDDAVEARRIAESAGTPRVAA